MRDDLWTEERRLWLDGAPAYRQLMHPDVLMVFPMPGGPLDHDAVLSSLEGVPRWSEVHFADRRVTDLGATRILVYTAEARRDADTYSAGCASVWTRSDAGWRLVLHQQTPL